MMPSPHDRPPTESPNQFWYRQKVVERIWEHHKKLGGGNGQSSAKLLQNSGYELNYFELARAARLLFGSWESAVRSSGLAVKNSGETQKFSKARLLEIIKSMAASGEDISAENMIIMYNDIWRQACGRNGYYSHWHTVLRSAGLDPTAAETEPYWNARAVQNMIMDLYESQLVINKNHIRQNFWHLYRYALRFFGSWPRAVDATGLGYERTLQECADIKTWHEHFQKNLVEVLDIFGRPVRMVDGSLNPLAANGRSPVLFGQDEATGALLGTIPRSWLHGLERSIMPLLNAEPDTRFEFYYLQGEPREWKDSRVKFISAVDLIEPSYEAGADEYMKNILALQYYVPSFL
jgi:hypothetical protein